MPRNSLIFTSSGYRPIQRIRKSESDVQRLEFIVVRNRMIAFRVEINVWLIDAIPVSLIEFPEQT
jgi:hypothetical protein